MLLHCKDLHEGHCNKSHECYRNEYKCILGNSKAFSGRSRKIRGEQKYWVNATSLFISVFILQRKFNTKLYKPQKMDIKQKFVSRNCHRT